MSEAVLPSHQVNLSRKTAYPLEPSSSGYSSGASPNMDLRREQAVNQAVASPPAQPSTSVAAAIRAHDQVALDMIYTCLENQHQQNLQQQQLWQHQVVGDSMSVQAIVGGVATALPCKQSSSSSVNDSPPTRASAMIGQREEPILPSMGSDRTFLRVGPSATKMQHLSRQEGQPKRSAWNESASHTQPRQAQTQLQLQHRDDDEAASQQARNGFRIGFFVTTQQHPEDQLITGEAAAGTGALSAPMAFSGGGGSCPPGPGMAEGMIPMAAAANHMAHGGGFTPPHPPTRQFGPWNDDTAIGRLDQIPDANCMMPGHGASVNLAVGRHAMITRQESWGISNGMAMPPGMLPQPPPAALMAHYHHHPSELLPGNSPMAPPRQSATGRFIEGALAMNAFQADMQPPHHQLLQRRLMRQQLQQQQQQREQLPRQHQQQQPQMQPQTHAFFQPPERRQQQHRCTPGVYMAENQQVIPQQQPEPPQHLALRQQQHQQSPQVPANAGLPLFNFVDPAHMDAHVRAKLGLGARRTSNLSNNATPYGPPAGNGNPNKSNGNDIFPLNANGEFPVQPSDSFNRSSVADIPLPNLGTGDTTIQALHQAVRTTLLGAQHPSQRSPPNGCQPPVSEVPPPQHRAAVGDPPGPVEGGLPGLRLAASSELLHGPGGAMLQTQHRRVGPQHNPQPHRQQQQDLCMQQQRIRQALLQRSGQGGGGGGGDGGGLGYMNGAEPFAATAEAGGGGGFGSGDDLARAAAAAAGGGGNKQVYLPMERSYSAPQADTLIAATRLRKMEKLGITPSEALRAAMILGGGSVGLAHPMGVAPHPMYGPGSCGQLAPAGGRTGDSEELGLCSEGGRQGVCGSHGRPLKRPAMEQMTWSELQGPLQHQQQHPQRQEQEQYTLHHQLGQQRQQHLQGGFGVAEPQDGGACGGLGGSGCVEGGEMPVDSGVVQPHKRRLFAAAAGEVVTTGAVAAVPGQQRTGTLQPPPPHQPQQGRGQRAGQPFQAGQGQGFYQDLRGEWTCRSNPGEMRGMESGVVAASLGQEGGALGSGPNGSDGGAAGRRPTMNAAAAILACATFGGTSKPPPSVAADMGLGGRVKAKMSEAGGMTPGVGSGAHHFQQPADVSCQLGGGGYHFHNDPVYSAADGRRVPGPLCGTMNPMECPMDAAGGTNTGGPPARMLAAGGGCGNVARPEAALDGGSGGPPQQAVMEMAALGTVPPDPDMPEAEGDVLTDHDFHNFIAELYEPGGPEAFLQRRKEGNEGPEPVLATGGGGGGDGRVAGGGTRNAALLDAGVPSGAMSSDKRRDKGAETGGGVSEVRGGGGGSGERLMLNSVVLDEEQRALQSEAEVLLDFKFD